MKKILFSIAIMSLGACSLFQPKEDSPAPAPKVREEAVKCPDAPECEGKYKSGVVCLPSKEHHSDQGKCPFKK